MCKLVFVNGQLSQALSDIDNLPVGVQMSFPRRWESIEMGSRLRGNDNVASANINAVNANINAANENSNVANGNSSVANGNSSVASESDGITIHVPDNVTFTMHEEYISVDEIPAVYATHIHAEISLGQGAKFNRIKIQKESQHATHVATTTIIQQKDSIADLVYYSIGGRSVSEQVTANLTETGAQCKTAGFYQLTRDEQNMDFNLQIHHLASHTESDMLFKCVADKKSRGEFTGRIHVVKDAQKIKAHQANHNILLSNQAEVYSRPQLEIYADDVKCKHGSTTGQLDQDALFFLRARGIEEQQAKAMLLEGFADEIMRRLPSPFPSPATESGDLLEQQLAGEGTLR